MISPETYKQAGWEYSLLRPYLETALWTPTPGLVQQALPTGVIGVEAINFGLQVGLAELYTSGSANSLWSVEGANIFISPAPVLGDAYSVVWQKIHTPVSTIDPDTHIETVTFPTIPLVHLPYVDMLEQAILCERDAHQIEQGPIIYQVGQTVVNRATASSGLRGQARDLRERVRGALERTVSEAPVGPAATPISLTAQ